MYSEEKIKFVESCLNELGDITEEQLKTMRFAIIKSIPRATLTDKLENELTKEIYKSSSKINNCLNRIKLPEMIDFSSEKIHDYIDIIIEDYENIKENAYLVIPQINYTMDLNIEDSREGANKRGNSSRLTQSFHFFMFEPIFSPVNALNQPI